MIHRFATSGLDRVLFSDEKLFNVEEVYNRQNDRIVSSITSLIPKIQICYKSPETAFCYGLGKNILKGFATYFSYLDQISK